MSMTLALGVSLALAACSGSGEEPAPTPSEPQAKVDLTFGLWAGETELAGYQEMGRTFNETSLDSQVTVRAWESHDALLDAVRSGGDDVPDVFAVSRGDLASLREEGLTVPVDELLDERGVDFGDRYSRAAQEAFSADRRLQCMPYAVSPMVIFYNTSLVRLDRMVERELIDPVGKDNTKWTFDQFAAAAEFATRPRRETRGVYIEPTLRGLAPFLASGGASLFDDDEQPTSLNFASDEARSALERTLEVLRDPQITLSEEMMATARPMEWFKRGKLGMIAGFRSEVPHLRQVEGLNFDVLPMPTLDRAATVAEVTGLCISSESVSVPEAADLLAHAVSAESVQALAQAGYLVPANLEVALSDDFLQPDQLPEHANVFNSTVRNMVIPPLLTTWEPLEEIVQPSLSDLISVPVLDDLEERTAAIDELSRTVLDPEGVAEDQDEE